MVPSLPLQSCESSVSVKENLIEKKKKKNFFLKLLPLLWKPQEKIKFWFIQESWMYFFVKSWNSQIFYIIKIMIFSKFAQKIYFYLIVASLYIIRSKLKMFIHSLMNDFKSSSPEENITKSCIFESNWFFWR